MSGRPFEIPEPGLIAPTPVARRLTAVLLADIVGYSRLMSRDEDATHERIARHLRVRVLEERAASHFLGGEGRGGKLLVTSRRLAFRPHRFNVQLATWSLPLSEIVRFECDRHQHR